jgi:hypothetical protein
MAKKELTPKQKATQLVALFESIAHPAIDCDKQFAKECARRCINETIKELQNRTYEQNTDFLEQVKQEIDTI